MSSFFKVFFASCLSLIAFTLLGILILIVIVSSVVSSDKPDIGRKGVLIVDLTKHYAEQKQEFPFAALTGNDDESLPGLFDVIRMIEHAKNDSAIRGIYIKCNANANGFASSQEIRNALEDFKTSKKFVIAYGEVISQSAYYVANVADRIYCNPKGGLDWTGMSTNLFFLRGTLEKLEIQPQIFYAGKFKSATEPLREYKMTEANKLQTSVYLNDLYSQVLLTAADKSKSDTATLHQLANTNALQTAEDAVRFKLLDAVKYDDEVKSEIIQKLGIKNDDKINFVSLSKYAKGTDFVPNNGSKIAVLYAEGEIVDGKAGDGQIGSDEFRILIRKLRLDESIKAVVVRINSPGGSALASEVIWRELQLTKKVKPVVVSLGDVAASGGYYMACVGDSIFAQPNTITGSIGVFGIIPNMEGFFKNKLGITFDGVKTGPFADLGNVSRPLNEAEKRFIQNSIDTIYHSFKSRVAEGRKLPIAQVDSIAQGRVWTGSRAMTIGLVDKIGNLNDAVNCAARLAKLKEFRVREYPEKKTFLQELMNKKEDAIKEVAIKKEIGEEQYTIFKHMQSLRKIMNIPQARLPFDMQIQ
ncbi:MAG: sppA [Segetibacter sp.]|nr:sppA [Segetibacter sp.]